MLAELDKMTNPRDPEAFDRIIGPERKLLENELAKKSEAAADPRDDWAISDPNF